MEGVAGEIDADNQNGKIRLSKVSGAVVAHALNGEMFVDFDRIPSGRPMSFVSMNGDVDVTLPADARARLRMKTQNGALYTDFDLRVDSPKLGPGQGSTISGSINGGGPEYVLTSINGKVFLRKRK